MEKQLLTTSLIIMMNLNKKVRSFSFSIIDICDDIIDDASVIIDRYLNDIIDTSNCR